MTTLASPDLLTPDWCDRPLAGTLDASDALVLGIIIHRHDDTYLEQSIASLVGQSRPLQGIVVAHMGATDPPVSICDRFPEVRLLASSGPAGTAALVEAIVAAFPADGYLFQEASDWSAPTRLEQLLRAASDKHAALVGSGYVVVAPQVPDAHTRTMPADGNAAFENGTGDGVIEPCTMLVDSALIRRLGGFNTEMSLAAAHEFAARAAVSSRVVNVSRVLYFRRPQGSSDWSSAAGGSSIRERIVFAALGERSRHHAMSMARRQAPDVTIHSPHRRPHLLHLGGPSMGQPSNSSSPELAQSFERTIDVHDRPAAGDGEDRARVGRAPVFVISASASLSRFVACALGQHPRLLTVEVSGWMTEVAKLAARYILAEREQAAAGSHTTATAEAVYGASSAAVDALFMGGSHGSRRDGNPADRNVCRWIGAVPAENATLAAAALLYPDAHFVHVARPVDDTVTADLRQQEDGEIEDLYRAWLTATNAILDLGQMLGSGRLRTVHYDQLVAHPEGVIRGWLAELGEDPDPACAAFLSQGGPTSATGVPIPDLTGVPVQLQAQRLSLALNGSTSRSVDRARTDVLSRVLTDGTTEVNRRRRASDVREDDRNPYSASHDLVRRSAPRTAVVCVVSKGDEMAVRIRGHSLGWHFPQTADGEYVGYHPKDARETIAHLEHLRDRGATLFLIPEVYGWWLEHYAELRLHLARTYVQIESQDGEGGLWDLRPADVRAAEPWGGAR